jgi:hypothetical protein
MSTRKTILISSLITLITSLCSTATAATQAQINAAEVNGITWLVAQQDPCAGCWNIVSEDGNFPAAGTGFALIKLEE